MRRLAFLLCLACAAFAGEPPGGYYSNDAWGFKMKVPKGWNEAAVHADTPWLCSKHLGKRELEGRTADRDWMMTEKPELWIVGFPHAKDGPVKNPYADYKEYAARDSGFVNFERQGYRYVVDGKQTKVGDTKVTIYELRHGKKKKVGRRILTWVFHFDDVDFAVQFKVLEWHADDYASSFRGCLKSFRRIERKAAVGGGATEVAVASRDELELVPASKRDRTFKDAVETTLANAIKGLPDDWRHQRGKHALLLTNADKKFQKAAMTHANAVIAHLDKLFGPARKGYQPPLILRIFATQEQCTAYGGDKPTELVRDISIYSGKGYEKDNSFEMLNQALWARWMEDSHPQLEKTLPAWFKEGFNKYMRMMRTKGRSIGFANDDWDRDTIRLRIKENKYESLLTVMSREIHDQGETNDRMESHERDLQVRTAVLWLMRDGNKSKRKNLIRNFLVHVVSAMDTCEKEWEQANPRPSKEGLEAWLSSRTGHVASSRSDILQAAWELSFAKWKDGDWKKLTKAWLSAAK